LTVHVLFTMYVPSDPQQRRFLEFIKEGIKGLNYLPHPVPLSTAIQQAVADQGEGVYRTAQQKYGTALADVQMLADEIAARVLVN
jgi:hypothetical protein